MPSARKRCSRCKHLKSLKRCFAPRAGRPGQYQSACKECMKLYRREHYAKNPQPYKDRAKERRQRLRKVEKAQLQQWVHELLAEAGCVDCGEKDPILLDYDHVRGIKRMEVSRMVNGVYSRRAIEQEIAKCEVVCANCHRRRTARRGAWYS